MKNIFDTADTEALLARLSKLNNKLHPHWGKLTVQQVVPHLTDPFRVAIGEKKVPMFKSIFATPGFNQIVLRIMPWPKAAPTAQEFLPGTGATEPTELEQDKQMLILTIHRFIQHGVNKKYDAHPVFGNISNNAWARVMWRHVDHHLTQFGV
jgi:hypothetical protein